MNPGIGYSKTRIPERLGPRCVTCGEFILRRLKSGGKLPEGPLPFSGELPEGILLYEGTECENCGNIYCMKCHDFGTKGPKCPNCGEWKLSPIFRAAAK